MNHDRDRDWTENQDNTLLEKAKGYGNQAKGKVKEGVSNITDDLGLRAEAEYDQIKGKAQVEGAEMREDLEDHLEHRRDANENLNDPIDERNRDLHRDDNFYDQPRVDELHREEIIHDEPLDPVLGREEHLRDEGVGILDENRPEDLHQERPVRDEDFREGYTGDVVSEERYQEGNIDILEEDIALQDDVRERETDVLEEDIAHDETMDHRRNERL